MKHKGKFHQTCQREIKWASTHGKREIIFAKHFTLFTTWVDDQRIHELIKWHANTKSQYFNHKMQLHKFNFQKFWHKNKLTCNQQFQIILNYFNKHFDQQNFWDQWSRNTYRIFHGNSCKIEIEFWGYTIVQIYTTIHFIGEPSDLRSI